MVWPPHRLRVTQLWVEHYGHGAIVVIEGYDSSSVLTKIMERQRYCLKMPCTKNMEGQRGSLKMPFPGILFEETMSSTSVQSKIFVEFV